MQGELILGCDGIEICNALIKYCGDSGLKDENLPNVVELESMTNAIKRHHSDLAVSEFALAFDLVVMGKMDVESHFQCLTLEHIGKVLRAYRATKREKVLGTKIRQNGVVIDFSELSPQCQQLENWINFAFNALFDRIREIEAGKYTEEEQKEKQTIMLDYAENKVRPKCEELERKIGTLHSRTLEIKRKWNLLVSWRQENFGKYFPYNPGYQKPEKTPVGKKVDNLVETLKPQD